MSGNMKDVNQMLCRETGWGEKMCVGVVAWGLGRGAWEGGRRERERRCL